MENDLDRCHKCKTEKARIWHWTLKTICVLQKFTTFLTSHSHVVLNLTLSSLISYCIWLYLVMMDALVTFIAIMHVRVSSNERVGKRAEMRNFEFWGIISLILYAWSGFQIAERRGKITSMTLFSPWEQESLFFMY